MPDALQYYLCRFQYRLPNVKFPLTVTSELISDLSFTLKPIRAYDLSPSLPASSEKYAGPLLFRTNPVYYHLYYRLRRICCASN